MPRKPSKKEQAAAEAAAKAKAEEEAAARAKAEAAAAEERQRQLDEHLAELQAKVSEIPPEKMKKMANAFEAFDADGSGKIDKEEIMGAMAKIGKEVTLEEAEDMIASVDYDKDGEINLEEFAVMMVDHVPEDAFGAFNSFFDMGVVAGTFHEMADKAASTAAEAADVAASGATGLADTAASGATGLADVAASGATGLADTATSGATGLAETFGSEAGGEEGTDATEPPPTDPKPADKAEDEDKAEANGEGDVPQTAEDDGGCVVS